MAAERWRGGGHGRPEPGGDGCSCSLCSPQYGKKKLKYLPYNHQHEYFFLSECQGAPHNHTPQGPSIRSRPTPLQTQKSPLSLLEQKGPRQ